MTDKNNFNFKAVLISAIVSTVFTILGALTISFLSSKNPALQYEILPISYFKRDSIQLSIVNIKIFNSGKKECEDVAMNVNFGSKINSNDYSIQKSSESIIINQKFDSTNGKISYLLPYLNPKEQILFSFLLNKVVDGKSIEVDLRSKGINGIKSNSTSEPIPIILVFGTVGMFVLTITLITVVVFHQKRVIKFNLQLEKLKDDEIAMLKKQLKENSKNKND